MRGALLGAATGLILGHHIERVDPAAAAAFFGLAGAVAGRRWDRAERRLMAPAPRTQSRTEPATPRMPDMHPGVDLIKISLLHSNGVRTDVPILRTGGRFIGPQGEEYGELPTSRELAGRYGM